MNNGNAIQVKVCFGCHHIRKGVALPEGTLQSMKVNRRDIQNRHRLMAYRSKQLHGHYCELSPMIVAGVCLPDFSEKQGTESG